jgi:G:T-mismatch repair DNA endonuclease (very short patch repair protein)
MHEHGCLHFHIQNKNLYKTEQKKVNTAIWKKKVDQKVASDCSGLSGGFRGIGRGFGL